MNLTNDYILMQQKRRVGIINGKKILDENKIEYETPYEKKIQGQKNGKRYSIQLWKKPKHITFRKTPIPMPIHDSSMKKSKKCKTTRKKRKSSIKIK